MSVLDKLKKQLQSMAYDSELMAIHNDYCDSNDYLEDVIHPLNHQNLLDCFEEDLLSLLHCASKGKVSINDSYYFFNHNGGMVSLYSLTSDSSPLSINHLAEWIIEKDYFVKYGISR